MPTSRRTVRVSWLVVIGACCLVAAGAVAQEFSRGDVDANGTPQISDSVRIFTFLFLGGDPLECSDAADVDDSGVIDITDGIYLLNYLFLGGAAPPSPFPACGIDTTDDALDCGLHAVCEAAPRLELHLDTSGGFTGIGSTDYHLVEGVLTLIDPFGLPAPGCEIPLDAAQRDSILASAGRVNWGGVAPTYRPPENPHCCCDQIVCELSIRFERGDTVVELQTTWCDESLTAGLVPADLLALVETLERAGDEGREGCAPVE